MAGKRGACNETITCCTGSYWVTKCKEKSGVDLINSKCHNHSATTFPLVLVAICSAHTEGQTRVLDTIALTVRIIGYWIL